MIWITDEPISPQWVIDQVKTNGSGCVLAYVGVIRDISRGQPVLSVEYKDASGTAEDSLPAIADEVRQKYSVENIACCHRVGKLKVGDINLVIAVAAAHRQDGFAACQYAIDRFKQVIPTHKTETYRDGSTWVEGG